MAEIAQYPIPSSQIHEKIYATVPSFSPIENTVLNIELLPQNHHPFLEAMAGYFETSEFQRFLEISTERGIDLNPDTSHPFKEGEDLLFDEEVLNKVDDLFKYVLERDQRLGTDTVRQVMKAAMFSIWAYGTNPDIKHRVRHEGRPYAIHPARAAYSFREFDDKTLQSIFLHDVTEDTPYEEKDLAELFSKDVATTVRQVTKIKSTNLEEFLTTEVSVIHKYLHMHENHPIAKKLLDARDWSSLEHSDKEIAKLRGFGLELLFDLQDIMEDFHDGDILTLMRLCSKIDTEEGARAFIVKLADVEDNMYTIDALASKKTKKKAKTKAGLAYNFFAPLGYALGVNDKATQIEEKAFHVLYEVEGNNYTQALARDQEQNDRKIAALQQLFDVDLKTAFIDWMNKYYPAHAQQTNAIRHEISMFTKADRRRYKMTRPYKPVVVVNCPDDVVRDKYEEFLCDNRIRNRHDITIKRMTPKVDRITDNRVDMRIPYGSPQRQNLTVYTREHNGEIADIFRPDATESQVEHGRMKLRDLQQTFKSGKFSEFMTRLQRGTKRVELTLDSSGHSRELYLPRGATYQDLLVLSGIDHQRRILNPSQFQLTDQVPEGESFLFKPRDESDRESRPDVTVFDRITTPEAARIQTLRIDHYLEDIANNPSAQENFKQRVLRRGHRIAETLIDSYILQRMYPNDPSQIETPQLESNFWKGLFEQEEFFSADNDYFYGLGLTPLRLPGRSDLKPKDIIRWVSLKPDLEDFITEAYNWIDRHCFILTPPYRKDGPTMNDFAQDIQNFSKQITVIDYEDQPSTVQLGHARPKQVIDARNITLFHPRVRILTLPVENGQLASSSSDYYFYASLDTHELEAMLNHVYPSGRGDVTSLVRGLYGHGSGRVFSAIHRKEGTED